MFVCVCVCVCVCLGSLPVQDSSRQIYPDCLLLNQMEAGKVDSGQTYNIPPTPRDHPLPCRSLPSSLVEGVALWCLRNISVKTSWGTGKPALLSEAHSSALLYVV